MDEEIKLLDQKTIKFIVNADDIVLVAKTEEDLRTKARAFIKVSANIGLIMNIDKTKHMILSRKKLHLAVTYRG